MFNILFLIINLIHFDNTAPSLTLHFSELRNNKGQLQIQFYANKKDFEKEKPLFTRIVAKAGAKQGKLSVTYNDIAPGTYGIAILDDENSNKKMDYGFMLPEEGFGFSDYYHTGFTHPDFEKFKFQFQENKTVQIKVRYL